MLEVIVGFRFRCVLAISLLSFLDGLKITIKHDQVDYDHSHTMEVAKRVKVFSVEEIEHMFPELNACRLTKYAFKMQRALEEFKFQAKDARQAQAIYLPAYLASECNWPHYGGSCIEVGEGSNLVRAGLKCRSNVRAIAEMLEHEYSIPVILNNMASYDACSVKHIWSKSNLLQRQYASNSTISMPPPPTPRCTYCFAKSAECWEQPLSKMKYNISFKGKISHPIRSLAATWNDPEAGIIIANSLYKDYDFDELIHNSKFVLILRGTEEFSYRFTEAVCSGGVPVLIADGWVPPFDRSFPFHSYGIRLNEDDVKGDWIAQLVARNMEDLESMRKQARRFCETSLMTLGLQAHQMLNEALSLLP